MMTLGFMIPGPAQLIIIAVGIFAIVVFFSALKDTAKKIMSRLKMEPTPFNYVVVYILSLVVIIVCIQILLVVMQMLLV